MKTQILLAIIVCLLFSMTVKSQENNRFYSTLEDYKNNKPIEGYEIVENSYDCYYDRRQRVGYSSETFKVKHDGVIKKYHVLKLPSALYTYENVLHRTGVDACAVVMVEGPICAYIYKCTRMFLWASETITGNFIGVPKVTYKGQTFEQLLKKYNLWDSYIQDKPKVKMFANPDNSEESLLAKRDIKYIKLINSRILSEE